MERVFRKILIGLFVAFNLIGYSTIDKDSLVDRLNKMDDDSLKLVEYRNSMFDLLNESGSNLNFVLSMSDESIQVAQKMDNLYWKGKMYYMRGWIQYNFSTEYSAALSDLYEALHVFESLDDKKNAADVKFNIGIAFYYYEKFHEAIEHFNNSYNYYFEEKDSVSMADVLLNVAASYESLDSVQLSLDYYNRAFLLYKAIEDSYSIAITRFNYNNLSLKLDSNISDVQTKQLIEENKDILDVFLKYGDLENACKVYFMTGKHFHKLNFLEKAHFNFTKASEIGRDISDKKILIKIYFELASLTYKMGRYKESATFFMDYINVNDSLFMTNQSKVIEELNTKYQTEKKEKENELLRKQGELDAFELKANESEIIAQKKQRTILFSGLGVAFILLVIIFNRFKVSQRQKNEIELQKDEIESQKKEVEFQKELIEEKNTEITDSINYARKIQQALLKSEEHVTAKFPPHFILFKPKDIVSGDFYWAYEKQDWIYISVSDCTGHGVPGAFMSMLGISLLNEINSIEQLLTPAEILDQLRNRIIRELSQTGEVSGSKDGMDMSLLMLNIHTNEIQWAGANNPLYLLNKGELQEIRADRQPVGYFEHATPFTNHQLVLETGVLIYMFSDGFIDQFGGEKGKKYKSKKFKSFLNRIAENAMEDQKQLLDREFENWRGEIEQIDDVCIIGVRL